MPSRLEPPTLTGDVAALRRRAAQATVATTSVTPGGVVGYIEATYSGGSPTLTAGGGATDVSADWFLANEQGSSGVTVDGSGVMTWEAGLYLLWVLVRFDSFSPSTTYGQFHNFVLQEGNVLGSVDLVGGGSAYTSTTGVFWTAGGADSVYVDYVAGAATTVDMPHLYFFIVRYA